MADTLAADDAGDCQPHRGRQSASRSAAASQLGLGASLYVLGIILLGVAIAGYSISDLVKHPVGLPWLILVALTVASGWAMLRIPGMTISFSISDTFNIAASLLFGPSAG